MDLSKLSPNQQLTLGAAALMFVAAFFPWYGVTGFVTWSGWDSGFLGVIGIVLIVGGGVILFLEAQDRAPVDAPAEIVFYLVAAGAGLILLRFLFRIGADNSTRKIGMYLAIVAAVGAAWGAYQNRLDNT